MNTEEINVSTCSSLTTSVLILYDTPLHKYSAVTSAASYTVQRVGNNWFVSALNGRKNRTEI